MSCSFHPLLLLGFEKATCIDTLMELQMGHPSILNSGETLPGDVNFCTHVQLLGLQIMRVREILPFVHA